MGAPVCLIGQRFGLLKVVRVARKGRLRAWMCACDCGRESVVTTGALRSGNTKSCGCRKQQVLGESTTTHGLAGTREYRIWRAMRTRCNNRKSKAYPRYGGRGIAVCARWDTFANFLADMGPAPPGTSLDRWPDNDGNYEPSNCRWATPKEQARNMRVNRMIEHEGETLCLAAWAERLGTTSDVLWKRLSRHGRIEI